MTLPRYLPPSAPNLPWTLWSVRTNFVINITFQSGYKGTSPPSYIDQTHPHTNFDIGLTTSSYIGLPQCLLTYQMAYTLI
jgi:hypothetical protein